MPRPKLQPTEQQRRLVKSLVAMGNRQEDIARVLGIRSPKTLRKHYRQELDRGALEANHNVAQTLYKMATSGQRPAATMFWLKTRAGWRERPGATPDPRLTAAPPFIVALDRGQP
jgi:hypothetical protein